MKLYRCYDNRLRPTERSPVLYGVPLRKTKRRSESTNGRCDKVLEIFDRSNKSPVYPFGQIPQVDITGNWLWEFCGQVKVICTEFHKGVHYAKLPEHFLPIIDHLEQLHENGYVHGDIRAYNMVLNYPKSEYCFRTRLIDVLNGEIGVYNLILDYAGSQKPEGWLIDFDFGGEIIAGNRSDNISDTAGTSVDKERNNPKYPKGYVADLADGLRIGNASNPITCDDDWFALGSIIFDFHELDHSDSDKALWSEEFRNARSDLMIDLPKKFTKMNGSYGALVGGPAKFLRHYLQLAAKHGFFFILKYRFRMSLQECHFFEDNRRNDSKGATGSPLKYIKALKDDPIAERT